MQKLIAQIISIPIGYYLGTHIGHLLFKIIHGN